MADQAETAAIAIDYPLNGYLFPPEIALPAFLWRDPAETATTWSIDIAFAKSFGGIDIASAGEPFHVTAIDPSAGPSPDLTPEQAGTHTPGGLTSHAIAHYVPATALSGSDHEKEALAEYRKAAEPVPRNPTRSITLLPRSI